MSYFDISGAVFNNQLRELETSDPVHADVFNAVFRQLINNDVALMEAASMFAGEKNKQAEFILNLKRTGKNMGFIIVHLMYRHCRWAHVLSML